MHDDDEVEQGHKSMMLMTGVDGGARDQRDSGIGRASCACASCHSGETLMMQACRRGARASW
jgi:hypothetical protein